MLQPCPFKRSESITVLFMTKTLSPPRIWYILYNVTGVFQSRCNPPERSWIHLKALGPGFTSSELMCDCLQTPHAHSGS